MPATAITGLQATTAPLFSSSEPQWLFGTLCAVLQCHTEAWVHHIQNWQHLPHEFMFSFPHFHKRSYGVFCFSCQKTREKEVEEWESSLEAQTSEGDRLSFTGRVMRKKCVLLHNSGSSTEDSLSEAHLPPSFFCSHMGISISSVQDYPHV